VEVLPGDDPAGRNRDQKLVRTARRDRIVQIRTGHHVVTTDRLPPDLRAALASSSSPNEMCTKLIKLRLGG